MCQSNSLASDQNFVPFIAMIFLQKRHNYVAAQSTFNRFCQNQITYSWHIHLQIFAESFVKFVQELCEICGKTNASLFLKTAYRALHRCTGATRDKKAGCDSHCCARMVSRVIFRTRLPLLSGNAHCDDVIVICAHELPRHRRPHALSCLPFLASHQPIWRCAVYRGFYPISAAEHCDCMPLCIY